MVIGPICESEPARAPSLDRAFAVRRRQELVVDPLVHVDPLDAGAGLAGVGAGAPQRGVGRGLDVGVRVDDQRVLAAGLDDAPGSASPRRPPSPSCRWRSSR